MDKAHRRNGEQDKRYNLSSNHNCPSLVAGHKSDVIKTEIFQASIFTPSTFQFLLDEYVPFIFQVACELLIAFTLPLYNLLPWELVPFLPKGECMA